MEFVNLDPVIHEKMRFTILVYLLQYKEADFVSLRNFTGATEGNLASHLRTLERKKYIKVRKTFVGRRPRTFYKLTQEGRKKLSLYLENLKEILKNIGG